MLCRNDIFVDHANNRTARLLHADPTRNEAVTFNMTAQNAMPVLEPLSELLEMERAGLLRIEHGQLAPLNEKRASVKSQARRDTSWSRIATLVSHPDIFSKDTRYPLIRERARELRCSEVTILKDLRRFWGGGQTKAALIGKFYLCGHKSADHQSSAGRKPHLLEYEIFRITPQDDASFRKAIEAVYLKKDGLTAATASDAFQRLLENDYSYNDGNGVRVIHEKGKRPTIRQFYRFLRKHYSFEVVTRRRKSDSEFERDHAPKTGSVQQDCLGIGHIYEIDATIADVFLVSSKDRSRIIGKPTLYLVIDRRSRLIVGFYVGLEAPSWPAAMHAILSISEDKAALCARYGVEYSPGDWPADAIYPGMFLADRGSEMMSRDSSLVVNGLEITVANLPKQRADYKPVVECGFKLVHRAMVDAVPGYEPPENATKRQGKRYDKDASLTLEEFISIMIKVIITHNRMPMPDYPLPATALLQGVRAIPKEIWNYEAPSRIGALNRFHEEHVRFSLLPSEKAAIRQEGIFFKGCFYSAPIALEKGWFVRTGKGIPHVDISYDRRLVDTIYVHDDKDPSKFYEARLLPKSRDYEGLSFDEVDAYEYMNTRLVAQYEQIQRQTRSDLHLHSDPIASGARKATKAVTQGKSRTSRKADTAADRVDERRLRRQVEAAMPLAPAPGPVLQSPQAKVVDQELRSADIVGGVYLPESGATHHAPTKTLSLPEKMKLKALEMQNAI